MSFKEEKKEKIIFLLFFQKFILNWNICGYAL